MFGAGREGPGRSVDLMESIRRSGVGRARRARTEYGFSQPVSTRAPPPNANEQSPARRVLVIEADRDARATLRHLVIQTHHRCAIAADGDEGWQLFRDDPADIILCDWNIGGRSAADICHDTRGSGKGPFAYFISLTERSDRTHFKAGTDAGVDDYMTRPVRAEELHARLVNAERALSRRDLRRVGDARLRRESRQNFEAARIDPLTAASNRRRLNEDLNALLSASRNEHHCLALLDVDRFKAYSDRFHHQAGDDALTRVVQAAATALRGTEKLYRYGGDEFLVILRDVRLPGAVAAMERVRAAIEALGIENPGGAAGVLTVSIGVAELSPDDDSAEQWVRRADAALFRAKRAGRNCVAVEEV